MSRNEKCANPFRKCNRTDIGSATVLILKCIYDTGVKSNRCVVVAGLSLMRERSGETKNGKI